MALVTVSSLQESGASTMPHEACELESAADVMKNERCVSSESPQVHSE